MKRIKQFASKMGNHIYPKKQNRQKDSPVILFYQGGVTPIGAVSRAATTVKMQSNGQGTFWGSVKWSSSVLGHYLRHYWRSRGVADPFAHAQLIDGQGSRAKIRRGQAVKVVFRWSKILTPVAALDTAPMGVTPPCLLPANTSISTPKFNNYFLSHVHM